ncbi:uncharacterized protein LOC118435784 [Folsomia candida]|nr:uncharacterized protein LOC118435784 [Folsomia candida]
MSTNGNTTYCNICQCNNARNKKCQVTPDFTTCVKKLLNNHYIKVEKRQTRQYWDIPYQGSFTCWNCNVWIGYQDSDRRYTPPTTTTIHPLAINEGIITKLSDSYANDDARRIGCLFSASYPAFKYLSCNPFETADKEGIDLSNEPIQPMKCCTRQPDSANGICAPNPFKDQSAPFICLCTATKSSCAGRFTGLPCCQKDATCVNGKCVKNGRCIANGVQCYSNSDHCCNGKCTYHSDAWAIRPSLRCGP